MKKLIGILLVAFVLTVSGCGKEQPKETETKQEEVVTENQQVQELDLEKNETSIKTADDLESKIDKFNDLEDGDPEKEQIRQELQALFDSVE